MFTVAASDFGGGGVKHTIAYHLSHGEPPSFFRSQRIQVSALYPYDQAELRALAEPNERQYVEQPSRHYRCVLGTEPFRNHPDGAKALSLAVKITKANAGIEPRVFVPSGEDEVRMIALAHAMNNIRKGKSPFPDGAVIFLHGGHRSFDALTINGGILTSPYSSRLGLQALLKEIDIGVRLFGNYHEAVHCVADRLQFAEKGVTDQMIITGRFPLKIAEACFPFTNDKHTLSSFGLDCLLLHHGGMVQFRPDVPLSPIEELILASRVIKRVLENHGLEEMKISKATLARGACAQLSHEVGIHTPPIPEKFLTSYATTA